MADKGIQKLSSAYIRQSIKAHEFSFPVVSWATIDLKSTAVNTGSDSACGPLGSIPCHFPHIHV